MKDQERWQQHSEYLFEKRNFDSINMMNLSRLEEFNNSIKLAGESISKFGETVSKILLSTKYAHVVKAYNVIARMKRKKSVKLIIIK
jgi:ligand-binding sensor protein